MTPRDCRAQAVAVAYAVAATILAELTATVMVRLTPGPSWLRMLLFAAVTLGLCAAATRPGIRLVARLDRQWDRADNMLPPTGGENDGHDCPQPGRLNP